MFPELLDDWIGEDNPVRVIDVFVDELDLGGLGFDRVEPRATGRPGYHLSVLLKLYIYGYLNRVQSSRRLARDLGMSREWGCQGEQKKYKAQLAKYEKARKAAEKKGRAFNGLKPPETVFKVLGDNGYKTQKEAQGNAKRLQRQVDSKRKK